MTKYRKRKKPYVYKPTTLREKALVVADTSGSYINNLIRSKLALVDRAEAVINELSEHCTYCKKTLNKNKGEGHKVRNKNAGYASMVFLCDACYNVRARRQHHLGVL
jgi:hypothetical protein